MQNLDLSEQREKIDNITAERLWVCEHYRILPTDKRYLSLTDSQVSILLNNWINSPSEDDLKRDYWLSRKPKAPSEDMLEGIGYSKKQIEEITRELNSHA